MLIKKINMTAGKKQDSVYCILFWKIYHTIDITLIWCRKIITQQAGKISFATFLLFSCSLSTSSVITSPAFRWWMKDLGGFFRIWDFKNLSKYFAEVSDWNNNSPSLMPRCLAITLRRFSRIGLFNFFFYQQITPGSQVAHLWKDFSFKMWL